MGFVFSIVSGPQWTTDGSNDLENGASNETNGKDGKKGNNMCTEQNRSVLSGFKVGGAKGGRSSDVAKHSVSAARSQLYR